MPDDEAASATCIVLGTLVKSFDNRAYKFDMHCEYILAMSPTDEAADAAAGPGFNWRVTVTKAQGMLIELPVMHKDMVDLDAPPHHGVVTIRHTGGLVYINDKLLQALQSYQQKGVSSLLCM